MFKKAPIANITAIQTTSVTASLRQPIGALIGPDIGALLDAKCAKPSPTVDKSREQLINRIAAVFSSRWHQGYVRGKLKYDPVFGDVIDWVRKCPVSEPLLDVGCGLGLLSHWLRARDIDTPILAIDPDSRKIEAARAAAIRAGLCNVEIKQAGALDDFGLRFGGIFLLDVLHYLPPPDRDKFLSEAASSLPAGGVVYIRNGLRDGSWRHTATRVEEWFVRFNGWIRTRGFALPTQSEISRHFPEDLFGRAITPLWGRTPFNSFRLAFVKR